MNCISGTRLCMGCKSNASMRFSLVVTMRDSFSDCLQHLRCLRYLCGAFREVCINFDISGGSAPEWWIEDVVDGLIKPSFGVRINLPWRKEFYMSEMHYEYVASREYTRIPSGQFRWGCDKEAIPIGKCIILYATYDPKNIVERKGKRRYGSHLEDVDKLVRFVESLNGLPVVLLSKKALGWRDKIDCIDWTEPEKLGYTQSQVIYSATQNAIASIGQYSTMGQLVTCVPDIKHFVWDKYLHNKATKVYYNMPWFVDRVSIWDVLDRNMFENITDINKIGVNNER